MRLRNFLICVLVVSAGIAIPVSMDQHDIPSASLVAYGLAAIAVGAASGTMSLIQRFSTGLGSSIALFRTIWTWLYIALNSLAALIAAYVASKAPLTLSFGSALEGGLCGLMGVAIIRTSVELSEQHKIGFSQLLRQIENLVADRAEGNTSIQMWSEISTIMADIDYEDAKDVLVMCALSIRENLPDEEQVKLNQAIVHVDAQRVRGSTASTLLGLLIYRVIGLDALKSVLVTYRSSSSIRGEALRSRELDDFRRMLTDKV